MAANYHRVEPVECLVLWSPPPYRAERSLKHMQKPLSSITISAYNESAHIVCVVLANMKFTISSAAALLSLASSALAAQQSRPFYLVAVSHFAAINNTAFVACHEGAAIEGFCVGQKIPKTKAEAATYRLNNTKQNPDEGLLSYQLVGNKFKGTAADLPSHV